MLSTGRRCPAVARRFVKTGSLLNDVRINTFSNETIPSHAQVVVVGGGIIGNSVAYHLGHMGVKDVVLLEQHRLTAGTTWHAAGLMVTFGSLSETSTEFRKYTRHLYSKLEEETGLSTGFKPCGFIELAADEDRLEEYRRVATFNRRCGVDVKEITPHEVQERFPLCKVDDILAGFLVEEDGRVNPVDAAMALAKGARMQGVKIVEGVQVTGVTSSPSRDRMGSTVTGVTLADGSTIQAEYVVNCAGMWARQFGQDSGVVIPNQAAEHYYLITDNIPGVDPNWPVVEDPSSCTYIRPEGDGLMVGLFETDAAAWSVGRVPDDFSFGEITPDWERMTPFVEKAMQRVPASLSSGLKKFFCGPESFTPDGSPIVGESPELRNYFVAAGLNSIGILSGGGIGRCVASWIVNGRPDVDVTGINIDRFHQYQENPDYRRSRVVETLGMVYKTHYPSKSKETARGAKRSAFHDRLASNGAFFKDVSGWEGADWFASEELGVLPEIRSHSWGRQDWFACWEAEHRACREGVVLMDMSFMAKFHVQGRDAGEALNRLCTADVDGPADTITYTQMLNEEGKLEADVTVTKLGGEKFLVVGTDTMHRHVETWLRRNLDPEGKLHVFVNDVTGGYAQLNLQGPRSRELLSRLTSEDLSHEAFPFRTARDIPVGLARVLVARITYVGELGYELHIPVEHALHVYESVVEKGSAVGLVHAGLKALGSLRMEKAYRDYGHDMDNTDTLLEVGLGFTADYGKPGGFIGKDRVLEQKEEMKRNKGLRRRLIQVLCKDPTPLMYHGEVLFRNGVCVGDIRAASYGHTLGGAVGLGHVAAPAVVSDEDRSVGCSGVVNKAFVTTGKWEVEIAGSRYPVECSFMPMYDSKNQRIKA